MNKIPTWLRGRFVINEQTGCWLWDGAVLPAGYGQIYISGMGSQLVHRIAYEDMIGPIPRGMHVDHVFECGCRFKHCVNPDHLEAVTPRINTQRHHDSKTHCANGHPREDLYISTDGKRRCRQCRRDNHNRWKAMNPERFRDLQTRSQKARRAAV